MTDDLSQAQSDYLEQLAAELRRFRQDQGEREFAELESLLTGGLSRAGGGAFLNKPGLDDRQIATNRVADTMGGVDLAMPRGFGNLLLDPTMEGGFEGALDLTVAEQVVAYGVDRTGFGLTGNIGSRAEAWYASVSVLGGVPQLVGAIRRGFSTNPFVTSSLGLGTNGIGAGVQTLILRSASVVHRTTGPSDDPALEAPYLVASIGIYRPYESSFEGPATSKVVTLEIYDATTSTVKASATSDFASFDAYETRILTCSYRAASDAEKRHDYQLRIKYAVNTLTSLRTTVEFGDASLAWQFNDAPGPYSPNLGRWFQTALLSPSNDDASNDVVQSWLRGESRVRLTVSADGTISWGDGANPQDVDLRRSGVGTLVMDDPNALAGTTLQIGAPNLGGLVQVMGSSGAGWALQVDEGGLRMSPSSGVADLKFLRQAAGRLEMSGVAADTTFDLKTPVGQRALLRLLVTGDTQQRVIVSGDATEIGIQLGPGGATAPDLRARRSGVKTLTIDDAAGGSATVNIVGSLQRNGVNVVDATETTAINANARVAVGKNSAGTVGTRRRINLIEGANVTITVADDAGNEEVDVTIAASAGGASASLDPFLVSRIN